VKPVGWLAASLGWFLVLFSLSQILASQKGLRIIHIPNTTPPVTVFTPASGDPTQRPVVLVGHGFSGSSTVMRGFSLTLAHAGYSVVTWDFDGHGTNTRPFPPDWTSANGALVADAEQALQSAVEKGLANPQQVAILGHSMGSGVALAYGQKHPETAATIAVSPVDQAVTPSLPKNMLLMAGTSEQSFLDNAKKLLAEAGGAGGDPKLGTARQLIPIQGANHLTILFSTPASQAARSWLDATFGVQPGSATYVDRNIWWYFTGVIGSLILAVVLAAWLAQRLPRLKTERPLWRRGGALLLGVLLATLGLWLVDLTGVALENLFGLLVGGYLLIWFALAGLISLFLLGVRLERITAWMVLAGAVTFSVLWLGVGLLGSLVWEPWLMIPRRLILWPLGTVLLLPWFLAVGHALRGTGWLGQAGWWLAESALVAGGLLLAMRINPSIGFLVLILPVFPAVFAVQILANAPYRGGWPFALSGALFTSWMLLVVFPLV
jgi:pimeloyl-ACP methyl ester carboxylesterase